MRTILAFVIVLALLTGYLPITAQAQGPDPGQELTFSDPAGDAGIGGIGPAGAAPLSEAFDLIGFRLYGEDVDGILIDIRFKDLRALPSHIDTFGSPLIVDTNFKLETTNVQYFLTIFVPNPVAGAAPTGIQPTSTNFCVTSGGRGGCAPHRAIGTVNWDESTLTTHIPKASLLGKDPVGGVDRQPAGLPGLFAGMMLSQFSVVAKGNFPYLNADRMPDAGVKGPYVFAYAASNDRLQLALANPLAVGCERLGNGCIQDFPQVSVSPDATTLVQVRVQNLNGNKRIVGLGAQTLETKDGAKWEMRILGSVTVPGSDSRVVNLIVNVSKNAAHRESMLASVTAKSVGFADEVGSLKLRLVASIPPTPRAPTLFLHARATQSTTASFCTTGLCGFGTAWLNTLEKDPRATGDQGVPMRQAGFAPTSPEADFVTWFRMDTPLNADLVLNPQAKIVATLQFRNQFPTPATASLMIVSEAGTVGQASTPMAVSGPTTITVTPLADQARIPMGATLMARVALRTGPPIGVASNVANPQIIPQGSKIEFPVIPDPTPQTKAIPLGPAFLTLSPQNESEQFVNPGKIKVYEVTVVNEGVQEDLVTITSTLTVDGALENPDWFLDIRPGSKYRLKPGDSATFGVLVKAPRDAKEGTQGVVLLNATSGVDPGALAQTGLKAIVTSGVELEDDGENYTVEEDTYAHYEFEADAGSPTVGLLAVVASIGLVLAFRRRAGR